MFASFIPWLLVFSFALWPFGGGEGGEGENQKALKKTSLEIPADSKKWEYIRILLVHRSPDVKLETSSPFQIMEQNGNLLFSGKRLSPTRFKTVDGVIQAGKQSFPQAPLVVQSLGDGIKWDGRVYRHSLLLWPDAKNGLTVVNRIPVEDYLKGVLPSEVNPKWPMEALKAQAVASRTYALFKALENQKERFDVSKDVMSQVYGGKTSEHSLSTKAVDATRGKILTYRSKFFPAYFHSTCGGTTTHAEYVWPVEAHPSLEGVVCEFCRSSKHYRWSAEFKKEEIQAKLKKRGIVSNVKSISIGSKDKSGRAKSFIVEDEQGKREIQSNDFRLWVDAMRFKSTLIDSIEPVAGGFRFKGRGWGHGVGLCQYGAKTLADFGYSYEDILKYYYPDTDITQLAIPADKGM